MSDAGEMVLPGENLERASVHGERRNEQAPAETTKAFALKPEFQMVWGGPPRRVPIEYRLKEVPMPSISDRLGLVA